MPLDDSQRMIIEGCLGRIEARRGSLFTAEQRERALKELETGIGAALLPFLLDMSADERDLHIDAMVEAALEARDETIRVPVELTADLLMRTPDSELSGLLYDYVLNLFLRNGAGRVDFDERQAILELPRGQRVAYTLSLLDGEVYNGGFQQFFTNSSGKIALEALEDCRLVGAHQHAESLARAIEVWEPAANLWKAVNDDEAAIQSVRQTIKAGIEPGLEALDSSYYNLEEIESLRDLIIEYVRRHPDECLPKRSD